MKNGKLVLKKHER